MAYLTRPNSWVSQDAAVSTQLTYALQLNPAPLTVSIAGRDPILGSLEFVITNPTASPISLNSVAFTFQVGTASSNLTTTTATVGTSVSDSTSWMIKSPGTVTSGSAVYTLSPQTGSSVSIAPGASINVQIYNFPTVENPGNTTITVKETTASTSFTSFLVSTFPSGFYFKGLSATAQKGSQLIPVAQVSSGAPVTLVWNSSVVDLASFTIYYSNAAQGQQQARPSNTGIWTSGTLTSDTVFTIVVTVSVAGGLPLTAALSTAVSVQNPSLIAASIVAGNARVNGPLTVSGATQANAITTTGLTVNGNTQANTIIATGLIVNGDTQTNAITATGLSVNGNTATGNLTARGTLSAPNQSNLGTVTISNTATIQSKLRIEGGPSTQALSIGGVGVFDIDAPGVVGGRFTVQNNGSVGIGGSPYSNVKFMVTNTDPGSFGILVDSRSSKGLAWALLVHGPCINTSGSWTRISDLALKNRIHPYKDGLETLLKINPVRYHYKAEMGLSASEEQIGVVAQDLQEVAPYMVSRGKIDPESDEEFLTINDSAMTYMLINAVKELHAEIEALKAKSKTEKAD